MSFTAPGTKQNNGYLDSKFFEEYLDDIWTTKNPAQNVQGRLNNYPVDSVRIIGISQLIFILCRQSYFLLLPNLRPFP